MPEIDKVLKKIAAELKCAANGGDAFAQYAYGVFCSQGFGVKADPFKAAGWFQKAAAKSYAGAEYALGECYKHGEGVDRDFAAAFEMYGRAAAQGFSKAQYALALCYTDGLGTEKDEQKAALWYKLFSKSGACLRYGFTLDETGGGIKLKDFYKAVEVLEQPDMSGNASAALALGLIYVKKLRDYEKAVMWYEKAAALSDGGALYCLGAAYSDGEGVPRDGAKAFEYYKKAADAGSADGYFALGVAYANGAGTSQDYIQARYWLEKAVKKGNKFAAESLETLRRDEHV